MSIPARSIAQPIPYVPPVPTIVRRVAAGGAGWAVRGKPLLNAFGTGLDTYQNLVQENNVALQNGDIPVLFATLGKLQAWLVESGDNLAVIEYVAHRARELLYEDLISGDYATKKEFIYRILAREYTEVKEYLEQEEAYLV